MPLTSYLPRAGSGGQGRRGCAARSKGFRLEVGLRALGIGFERQHRSDRPQVDDSLRVEVLPGEEFAQRQRIARNFTLGRVILRLRPRVRAENNASALAEAAPLSPPRAVNAHRESPTGLSPAAFRSSTAPGELPLPGERRSKH